MLGFALAAALSVAAASPPNIVVITVDTLRADHVGAYGRVPSPTPVLDALATRSLLFEDATSPAPLTLPAHATLFSGLDPGAHGVLGNHTPLSGSVTTFVDDLRRAGYASAAFVSSAPVSRGSGLDPRFDWFDDTRPDDLGGPRYPPERRGAATAAAAAGWIARAPEPFVVWVHLFDPHDPYTPPPEHDRFADDYDGDVAAADAAIGVVLDALSTRGIDARTALVVTADHGEGLGDHGELTHGVFLYQETIHVPLLLSGPGVTPGRVSAPVGLIDVAPTVLAIAGLPEALPGVDLRTLPEEERTYHATTRHGADRYNWAPLDAIRQGPWKYVHAPVPELYHLGDDPGEQDNVIDRRPDVAARLRRIAQETSADPRLAQLAALGYVGAEAPTAGPDPKLRAHLLPDLEKASLALFRDDFDTARDLLVPVVREDPTNPVAWNDLGMAWIGLARFERAADAFRAGILVSPHDATLWNNLGLAESWAGNSASARAAYVESARLSPSFAAPCVNLAVMYWRTGNNDAARRWASEALDRDPDVPEAVEVLDHTN